MNFTSKNFGDCAVWTRPDGSNQSVKITGYDVSGETWTDELRISWQEGAGQALRSVYLPRSRWNELTLFPAGVNFMVV